MKDEGNRVGPRGEAAPTGLGVIADLFESDDDEFDWQEEALCAQTDPEAFFPEKGGSTREAKRICGGCAVRSECLEYALAHDERFGIWGGLSERERRKLKKRPDDVIMLDGSLAIAVDATDTVDGLTA